MDLKRRPKEPVKHNGFEAKMCWVAPSPLKHIGFEAASGSLWEPLGASGSLLEPLEASENLKQKSAGRRRRARPAPKTQWI